MFESEEKMKEFTDSAAELEFRGKKLNIGESTKLQPVDRFKSFAKMIEAWEPAFKEATEEEVKRIAEMDIKDKLIPYHNLPYE